MEAHPEPESLPLQVVATAGHVDHGKSSLIIRLTGIDPDRWEEEKRRGLTIDLGFAWCTLPSGREIGFVDVPGHERFVRNMLAGVGPVRLVLFVVAADEGWKPQSEEHLAIVDVLGTTDGLVALTKSDLVDGDTLQRRRSEIAERLAGTGLEGVPIVACSSNTGEGLEELRNALDAMVGAAPPPEDRGRPRIHVDRSFTIRGAGTVVTGTLTGGSLAAGQEVQLHPAGTQARVRSLQTHRRPVQVARPVSRVAANLAGLPKGEVERGDVLTRPDQWRPTSLIEARLIPVRSLSHSLTARGAYKLYAGSSETESRFRLYGTPELRPGDTAYARVRLSRPIVAEVGDRFVLREAGRRETVAGGVVLDPDPPARPGPDPAGRLARREQITPGDIDALIVSERGAIRAADLTILAGSAQANVKGALRVGAWWVSEDVLGSLTAAVRTALGEYHREHPLRPGVEAADVRRILLEATPTLASALDRGLGAALIARLQEQGELAREGTTLRLTEHRVSLGEQEAEANRLLAAVRQGEPTPPTIRDLERAGFSRELVEASCTTGLLVRISSEIVVAPEFAERAEDLVRAEAARAEGITVSRFRELLGTTRKYALPLLEWFDSRGITRRDGDVRRLS
ncbi:MAG TPA: selenocysteine-specific translation elongation factor [Actinomycetota bacterium]|nr:selenocysteine-specific translation elongation factor [Actinomycetota bacterium]